VGKEEGAGCPGRPKVSSFEKMLKRRGVLYPEAENTRVVEVT